MKINNIAIDLPRYGYTTQIAMFAEPIKLSNGKTRYYDYGKAHDKYSCSAVWATTEPADFEQLMHSKMTTYSLSELMDFRPFGNHWNYSEAANVAVRSYTPIGWKALSKMWEYKIDMLYKTPLSISAPIGTNPHKYGRFAFAGLTGLPEPESEMKREYGGVHNQTSGHNVYSTVNQNVYDRKTVALTWNMGAFDAQNVIFTIVNNVRFQRFQVVPSGGFLMEFTDGNGSAWFKLADPKIIITHENADRWKIEITITPDY